MDIPVKNTTLRPQVRDLQTFSVKGWRVNILGFVVHRVWVPTIQLIHSIRTVAEPICKQRSMAVFQ